MIYVVGSGPAGIACSQALLDAGADVTVLDVGRECEPEVLERVGQLRRATVENWDPTALNAIKGPVFRHSSSRDALKLVYGSDFAYATGDSDIEEQFGTACVQSFARGGLSNVWGAAVLPYRAEDLHEWPIALAELDPHYAAVARMIGIAGVKDSLAALFPFHEEPRPGLRPSRQAEALERRLGRRRAELEARGIFVGRSRLAVRTTAGDGAPACQTVGLCLTGCPYGAIYSASDSLSSLMRSPRFRYLDGWKVDRVTENPGGAVTISARSAAGDERRTFTGERVFLAAGVISTARIVLRSLDAYDAALRMRYHPYFLLPMVTFRNIPGVTSERLHTLAQLFVEIRDPAIVHGWIHLQVYTYNEAMRRRLESVFGRLPRLSAWAERRVLGRLLAIQGYLPGDADAEIELRLQRRGDTDTIGLRAGPSPNVRRRVQLVCAKLLRSATLLGALPAIPLLHIGRAGEGNHIGALFPMRIKPGRLESDVLGRVGGFHRTHAVDASVLPSLPATTLTYTSMANAHRIATWAMQRA